MTTTIIAVVLAGGEGTRLRPLTADLPKALVPFCNTCALIDFALSNIVNSGVGRCYVVVQDVQYDKMSQHINEFRKSVRATFDVQCVSPYTLGCSEPFGGTADALLRTLDHASAKSTEHIDLVYVCGADHVYLFDVRLALEFHGKRGAASTIIGGHVPLSDANRYGIVSVDKRLQVFQLNEKPKAPEPDLLCPDKALVSMGDYIFNAEVLSSWPRMQGRSDISCHLVPDLLARYSNSYFFNFDQLNCLPRAPPSSFRYWRDIGTVASYWQASMNAVTHCRWILERSDLDWPLYSGLRSEFLGNQPAWTCSAVSVSCISEGAPRFSRCIVFPGSKIYGGGVWENAIILGPSMMTSSSPCKYFDLPDEACRVAVYA